MHLGWFVGDFIPSTLKTAACEVAVKRYKRGEAELKHYHKIATEVTHIIIGTVLMNGVEYTAGDIIVINPMEETDFKALTDVINAVVKIPSIKNDKYISTQ